MSVISFLSDFGLRDEFVGAVHGVIGTIAPQVRVIDVTHEVPRGDVRWGALSLMRAVQYLPAGVVLAVVDPGVGGPRRPIAAESSWGFFVGPDNGLLTPAVTLLGGATRVVAIESEEVMIPAHGTTFDGRDRFAPAAALLASGQAELSDLGPDIPNEALTPLLLPLTETTDAAVSGEVWWIDHFGNAQTNITPEDLAAIGAQPGDTLLLSIGAAQHPLPWLTSYQFADPGGPLLHVDSAGLIAVAVREGRADDVLNLAEGVAVTLSSTEVGVEVSR